MREIIPKVSNERIIKLRYYGANTTSYKGRIAAELHAERFCTLQASLNALEGTDMKKQIAMSLACFALLAVAAPNLVSVKTTPGYQTVNNTGMKNCPKGKRWDERQHMCIKEG
jgi:hypothetical protein